jgi:hypothetical protein
MNTFTAIVYRDLACAATATLITLLLGVAFVQSTSLPPGTHAPAAAGFVGVGFVAVQPQHAWFGQPEPAVLVD